MPCFHHPVGCQAGLCARSGKVVCSIRHIGRATSLRPVLTQGDGVTVEGIDEIYRIRRIARTSTKARFSPLRASADQPAQRATPVRGGGLKGMPCSSGSLSRNAGRYHFQKIGCSGARKQIRIRHNDCHFCSVPPEGPPNQCIICGIQKEIPTNVIFISGSRINSRLKLYMCCIYYRSKLFRMGLKSVSRKDLDTQIQPERRRWPNSGCDHQLA